MLVYLSRVGHQHGDLDLTRQVSSTSVPHADGRRDGRILVADEQVVAMPSAPVTMPVEAPFPYLFAFPCPASSFADHRSPTALSSGITTSASASRIATPLLNISLCNRLSILRFTSREMFTPRCPARHTHAQFCASHLKRRPARVLRCRIIGPHALRGACRPVAICYTSFLRPHASTFALRNLIFRDRRLCSGRAKAA